METILVCEIVDGKYVLVQKNFDEWFATMDTWRVDQAAKLKTLQNAHAAQLLQPALRCKTCGAAL